MVGMAPKKNVFIGKNFANYTTNKKSIFCFLDPTKPYFTIVTCKEEKEQSSKVAKKKNIAD